jgi:hypothetical protein
MKFFTKLFLTIGIIAISPMAVQSQVVVGVGGRHGVEVGVGVGVNLDVQPNCPYGYYETSPYECATEGYYGPEYFYNGIFLGVGPWKNFGYRHGWGDYRFQGGHSGRYDNRHARRSNREERNNQHGSKSSPNRRGGKR